MRPAYTIAVVRAAMCFQAPLPWVFGYLERLTHGPPISGASRYAAVYAVWRSLKSASF